MEFVSVDNGMIGDELFISNGAKGINQSGSARGSEMPDVFSTASRVRLIYTTPSQNLELDEHKMLPFLADLSPPNSAVVQVRHG